MIIFKYLMQAIISRNAIGFVSKPKEKSTSEPPDVSNFENSKGNESENTGNKSSEPEFDMIKLMKLAVAIESNPWKKFSNDKNLLETTGSATFSQTNHVETRDNFSRTQ